MAQQGQQYILYSRESTEQGELGLIDIPDGHYKLRWLDCITGQTIQKTERVSAIKNLTVFKKPQGLGAEVAVYIMKA